MKRSSLIIILLIVTTLLGCRQDKIYPKYITENVIIVVIDGARYSETWGEPSHSFIPNQSILRHQGVLFDNFSNDGTTKTVPGHTAMTTGIYQNIVNGGLELPDNPSIFQVWRKEHKKTKNKAWIITSKDKLAVLGNTSHNSWENEWLPSMNCGVNGAGLNSGYRHDSLTMERVFEVFNAHQPNLVLINFREPDFSGHEGDWVNYLAGITKTDEYVQQIWDYIENDPNYKGKTTLFVTNDHGRHLDTEGGFVNHGDKCSGCRHIGLLAIGPDFRKNIVVSKNYNQTNIAHTVAELLHFNLKHGEGNVIWQLLK